MSGSGEPRSRQIDMSERFTTSQDDEDERGIPHVLLVQAVALPDHDHWTARIKARRLLRAMRAHDQAHSPARMSAQGCARSNEMQGHILSVRGAASLVIWRACTAVATLAAR